MSVGIIGKMAPELRVSFWIDETGARREPLKLADLGPGYKVLYCFQDWCPGCHSRGFPTLKRLVKHLSDKGFGFAVIQTVFEGAEQNTLERLRVNQKAYDLHVPFGHDAAPAGKRYPTVMEDYRTEGTPWFIVINPAGEVAHNDFQFNSGRFAAALERAGGGS